MSPQSIIHNNSTRCSQFGKLIQKKYQVVSQKKKKKKKEIEMPLLDILWLSQLLVHVFVEHVY